MLRQNSTEQNNAEASHFLSLPPLSRSAAATLQQFVLPWVMGGFDALNVDIAD